MAETHADLVADHLYASRRRIDSPDRRRCPLSDIASAANACAPDPVFRFRLAVVLGTKLRVTRTQGVPGAFDVPRLAAMYSPKRGVMA